jgi:hypothetical protein|tara:strand:- start:128 stop:436 length:309 start_codon:yes stop_codon:yes gene_type:complete
MPEARRILLEMTETINTGDFNSVKGGATIEFGLNLNDLVDGGTTIKISAMRDMLAATSKAARHGAEMAEENHKIRKLAKLNRLARKAQERDTAAAEYQQEKR